MKKKGFNIVELLIVIVTLVILVAIVISQFADDRVVDQVVKKTEDPFEIGIDTISVGNTALGIEPAKFYLVRDDLAKEWGHEFVQFKGVGDERNILEKIDYSNSPVILDLKSFDPEEGYLGENTIYPESPDWSLWQKRFKIILERYAEKLRRLRLKQKKMTE